MKLAGKINYRWSKADLQNPGEVVSTFYVSESKQVKTGAESTTTSTVVVATTPRFAPLIGSDGTPLREPITSDYRRFSGDRTATLQPRCFLDFRTIRQSPWIGSLLQTGGKIIQGLSQSLDKSGQVIRLELDRFTGWIIGDRC